MCRPFLLNSPCYRAYSTILVSRIIVSFMRPGYCKSDSICLAILRANSFTSNRESFRCLPTRAARVPPEWHRPFPLP